jgi:hypothetical protein
MCSFLEVLKENVVFSMQMPKQKILSCQLFTMNVKTLLEEVLTNCIKKCLSRIQQICLKIFFLFFHLQT